MNNGRLIVLSYQQNYSTSSSLKIPATVEDKQRMQLQSFFTWFGFIVRNLSWRLKADWALEMLQSLLQRLGGLLFFKEVKHTVPLHHKTKSGFRRLWRQLLDRRQKGEKRTREAKEEKAQITVHLTWPAGWSQREGWRPKRGFPQGQKKLA